jgi:hypothetical protein
MHMHNPHLTKEKRTKRTIKQTAHGTQTVDKLQQTYRRQTTESRKKRAGGGPETADKRDKRDKRESKDLMAMKRNGRTHTQSRVMTCINSRPSR